MRSFVPDYDMVTARNLDDALARLPEWKPFAGGTDLMVLFEAGKLPQKCFVDIWRLSELKGIDIAPDHVTLGALTTYTEVQRHDVLRREFPMLCRAAAETGGVATRNRGTLGGNIVNASPAADSPPALLAYGAEIELTSRVCSRWIAYDCFHTGYKQMDMRPDEILTRIRLPRDRGPDSGDVVHYYRKVGTRKAQAIAKICFAGYARRQNGMPFEIRIGLGSVAPAAIRSRSAERAIAGGVITAGVSDAELIETARQAILGDISPIDDMRSTFEYRSRVTANLVEDFVSQLTQR